MVDKSYSNEALIALEKSLRDKLNPIELDQNFVLNLRRQLEDSPIHQQQRRLAVQMLTVAAGLVVGLLVFLIGRGLVQKT